MTKHRIWSPAQHRLAVLSVLALLLLWELPVSAMPMFARKYHVACSTCHDAPAIPRLNATGYKFRRAGFRMPEQIGEDEANEFTITDYFSGQVKTDFSVDHANRDDENGRRTNSTFTGGLSLYPLTGSFQRHWATEVEFAVAPGETPELENGYLRGTWGSDKRWFEARAGIFHALEGFGGSDRPLGITAPLFETEGALQTQDTLFRMTEMNRLGADVGIQWKDTSLTAQVVNSLNTVARDGAIVGVGTTPTLGNRRDLNLFANQILGSRSGVSAYWAHGFTYPPLDPVAFSAGSSGATWRNAFDRLALFGSVGADRFTALAGGMIGFDQSRNPDTGQKTRFRSGGAFVEGDVGVKGWMTAFVRLDYFDPSASLAQNGQRAGTLGAVLHDDWVYAVPEFQYRVLESPDGRAQSEAFVLRLAAIY